MKIMNIQNKLNKIRRCLKYHSPTILAFIASGGVVATAVLTIKAVPKAMILREKAEEEKGGKLTGPETVLNTAPAYIPAIVTGTATVFCIFGANALNKRQQQAVISAYALLDRSFKEYKNKTKEMMGEDGEFEIRKRIAQDKFTDSDVEINDDCLLFYDEISGRYFNRTMEEVIEAEYHLNRNFVLRGYSDLNEFYDFLDIPNTDYGHTVGWSMEIGEMIYGYQWIDFYHEKITLDDGLECYYIHMPFPPTADFIVIDMDDYAKNTLPIVKGG